MARSAWRIARELGLRVVVLASAALSPVMAGGKTSTGEDAPGLQGLPPGRVRDALGRIAGRKATRAQAPALRLLQPIEGIGAEQPKPAGRGHMADTEPSPPPGVPRPPRPTGPPRPPRPGGPARPPEARGRGPGTVIDDRLRGDWREVVFEDEGQCTLRVMVKGSFGFERIIGPPGKPGGRIDRLVTRVQGELVAIHDPHPGSGCKPNDATWIVRSPDRPDAWWMLALSVSSPGPDRAQANLTGHLRGELLFQTNLVPLAYPFGPDTKHAAMGVSFRVTRFPVAPGGPFPIPVLDLPEERSHLDYETLPMPNMELPGEEARITGAGTADLTLVTLPSPGSGQQPPAFLAGDRIGAGAPFELLVRCKTRSETTCFRTARLQLIGRR